MLYSAINATYSANICTLQKYSVYLILITTITQD